jgi:hypothetical protein
MRALPSLAVLLVLSGTTLAVGGATHLLTRDLVNEGVYLKNYRKPFFEESMIAHKMEYALGSREANDVIVLGDSAALMDIDIEQLQKATHLRAYNLGTMGWLHADGHLDILKNYLAHHPKPRLIVYTVLPKELTADNSVNDAFKDRFIWAYGIDLKQERGFKRWPLELRLREEFRTLAGLITGGRRRYVKHEVAPSLTHDQLGVLLARRRGFFTRDAKQLTPYELHSLRLSEESASRLRRLASFVRDNGIALLLRLGPIPRQKTSADQSELSSWFERFQKEFSSSVLVDKPLILQYELNRFSDTYHLNRAGTAQFTAAVAERVSRLKLTRTHDEK